MPRDIWIINPRYQNLAIGLGLTNAHTVEQMPGIVVSGHVRRNVSRVAVKGRTVYIKREHEIRLRDRLRAWREGHGLACLAQREVNILGRLQELAPTWLAWGESAGKSWLVLDSLEDYRVFCTYFAEENNPFDRRVTLQRVATAIAKIHDRGVFQRDLFAKHILVHEEVGLKFLDWQRGKIVSSVSIKQRLECFKRFYSSMPSQLLTHEEWKILLAGYIQESQITVKPEEWLCKIQEKSSPSVKARLSLVPAMNQELIRHEGEKLCAIPAYYASLLKQIEQLYGSSRNSRFLKIDGDAFLLENQSQRVCLYRCYARLRGKVWRSAQLQKARLMLHLQRYGLVSSELIAYGQTPTMLGGKSFVLSRPIEFATPLDLAIPQQARGAETALARLHEIGVILNRKKLPFLFVSGELAYDIDGLRLYRNLKKSHIERDQNWIRQQIEIAQQNISRQNIPLSKEV